MRKLIKKLIALAIISMTLCTLPITGASAEWRQDSSNNGWWYAEGNSWVTGWKQIDGNWYYFNKNGYMVRNTTLTGGYRLGADGVWIENYKSK